MVADGELRGDDMYVVERRAEMGEGGDRTRVI